MISDHVIVLAENEVHAGQLENLKALIAEMAEYIEREEPGTLNYEWYVTEDGTSAHVYERYANSDIFLEHLAVVGQKYGERLFSCLTIKKMSVYGNPNAKVREMFAPFAPVIRGRIGGMAR